MKEREKWMLGGITVKRNIFGNFPIGRAESEFPED